MRIETGQEREPKPGGAIVIEAPKLPTRAAKRNKHQLFLAGGSGECPDWQKELIANLSSLDHLTIYNPRRNEFDLKLEDIAEKQIKWELKYLQLANMHLFWFPEETLAPITLLECGIFGFGLSKPGAPTFIGIEPGYKRAKNMIITAKELRPDIVIVHTLDDLAKQITDYVNGKKTRK